MKTTIAITSESHTQLKVASALSGKPILGIASDAITEASRKLIAKQGRKNAKESKP
jgi:hypothetical protein